MGPHVRTLFTAGLVILAMGLGAARVAAQKSPPLKLVGKIKKVEDDGSFSMKSNRGTYAVARSGDTAYFTLEGILLERAAQSSRVAILGRRQESVRDPNTQMEQPEQIIQIQAILVFGEGTEAFPAPELAKAHEDRRLEWLTGIFKHKPSGFVLDESGKETNMQWGAKRTCIQVSAGAADAVKKRALVLVAGAPDVQSRKKRATAVAISFVGRKVPQDQLAALVE